MVQFFYHYGTEEDIPFLEGLSVIGSGVPSDVVGFLRFHPELRKSRLPIAVDNLPSGFGEITQKNSIPKPEIAQETGKIEMSEGSKRGDETNYWGIAALTIGASAAVFAFAKRRKSVPPSA